MPREAFQAIVALPTTTVPMVWLILECILALLLFVFVVWWTLPRKRKGAPESESDQK